jgi:hypothetical protein
MTSRNIFVFGCSFTKDNYQQTWADLLAEDLGLNLINAAERGAGSNFVLARLMVKNITDKDYVAIMWPSADRLDLWADHTTPHLLHDYKYASWPDGKASQFVDYQGRYSTSQGFNLNGSVPRGHKHNFYKYFYSAHSAVNQWLMNILCAQSYLISINVKYVMCASFPLLNPIHYHHDQFYIEKEIYNKIDLSRFAPASETKGFFNFCLDNDLPFLNTHHPTTEAHRKYVNDVLKSKTQELFDM